MTMSLVNDQHKSTRPSYIITCNLLTQLQASKLNAITQSGLLAQRPENEMPHAGAKAAVDRSIDCPARPVPGSRHFKILGSRV